MTEQDPKLSYQQLSVVDLLKSNIQSRKDAIRTLENKAQHNFTIINIVAAIVAALNLELAETYKIQQLFSEQPIFILIFIGYAAILLLSIWVLVPREQGTAAMTVSLKNAQDWSSCDLEHHYDILIKSYVQIYEHNEKIVIQKGKLVKWAHILIVIVIGLIFWEVSGL